MEGKKREMELRGRGGKKDRTKLVEGVIGIGDLEGREKGKKKKKYVLCVGRIIGGAKKKKKKKRQDLK